MITPPYLKQNDKVVIIAPAKRIAKEVVNNAVKILTEWGLSVVVGQHVFSNHNYFSGTDQQRIADFQEAINDIEVKAVFFARGGYGSLRIVDQLDFMPLKKYPKWLIGFSDITVFHQHLHNIGIETIHGTMPLNFYDYNNRHEDQSLNLLKNILFGEPLAYQLPSSSFNQLGYSSGELVGGNLSVMNSLLGSSSEINTDDKILFLEEVGESAYRIDRLLYQLKRSGKLNKLKGLIIGGFSDITDNTGEFAFNQSVEEMVMNAVGKCNFPICFHFPSGHINPNYPLIMGRKVNMNVTADEVTLEFVEKTENHKDVDLKHILLNGLYIIGLFLLISLFYSIIMRFLL